MSATRESDFQQRLLETFQAEAREHIEGLASNLLELEKIPEPGRQQPVLEGAFRQVHNLKGAARAVNAHGIETVCQVVESVFARLKRHELTSDQRLLDVLHQAVDVLEQLLAGEGTTTRPLPAVATRLLEQLGPLGQESSAGRSLHPPSPYTPSQPVAEPEGAASAKPPPATIRLQTAQLDRVLFEAEEMLAARLAAEQRAQEVAMLHHDFRRWRDQAHNVGQSLRRGATTGPQAETAKVAAALDFISQNQDRMKSFESQLGQLARAAENDHRELAGRIERLLDDAKEALMLPFSSALEVLPRMMRSLARQQEKEVELMIEGAEIQLDRRILDEMRDPLIHLIRNSLDHGIEGPEERQRANKPARGTIRLGITHRSDGTAEILITDDGRGIEASAVKAAALQNGLRSATELEKMNPKDVLPLIFESGFSTVQAATDVSGRGLGLSIVRDKVEQLGGTITFDSTPGQGTRFRLRLPLTLARFRGVLVRVGEQLSLIPTSAIHSVTQVRPDQIKSISERETIFMNGQTIPLASLAALLRAPSEIRPGQVQPALIVGVQGKLIALLVDELITEQEVLMKKLGPPLVRVRHVAGATVLGDGRVAPILSVRDLVKAVLEGGGTERRALPTGNKPVVKNLLVAEDSITARTLLKNILQGAGYKVETAVDGLDAWGDLQNEKYDLLISDVDMPRMNGFDLTRRIRANAKLADLPVVLVTALASAEDRTRGLDAGANAYVVKSNFDQSNLLATVARLL